MRIFNLKSLSNNDFLFIKEAGGQGAKPISLEEFVNRMKRMGWTAKLNQDGDNYLFSINTDDGNHYSLTTGIKAWDQTNGYKMNYRDLRRQCPDTAKIVFENKFEIPENFNTRTQKIEKEKMPIAQVIRVPFAQLPYNELKNKTYEILKADGKWYTADEIDFNSKEILFDDGSILSYSSPKEIITVRQKIS